MSKTVAVVLLWLASVVVLALGPQAAHASVPKVSQGQVCNASWGCGPWSTADSSGASASCAGAPHPAGFTENFNWNGGSPVLCYWQNTSGGSVAYTWGTALSCPANSTGTSSCTCNSGYVEDPTHTSCVTQVVSDCLGLIGQSAGSSTWAGTASDYYFCDAYNSKGNGQCVVHAMKDIGWGAGTAASPSYSQGLGSYTGAYSSSCSGSGTTSTAPSGTTAAAGSGTGVLPTTGTAAPAPCPDGQAPGTVNGVTSCFPIGPSTPTTAASPDTGGSTKTNADGTSTVTATTGTTTCAAGQCTTTTTTTVTTKDASGNTTGSSSTGATTTQAQASFCATNPTDSQCGAITGGSTGNAKGCTSNSSAAGCGGPAAGIGTIWTGKGVTVAQVLQQAQNTLSASPIGSAVGGFFTVSGGGSCPTSSWAIPYLNKTVEVDTWCSSFAGTMFAVIRGVLLMVAGFMAFRIAIE